MVKLINFALFSIPFVYSKPQFGDLFNEFSNQFVDIFGGVDVDEIISQAEQGFQSVLDAAGGLSSSELFQNLNLDNLPFNLDSVSDINELTQDLVNNALDFSVDDLSQLTSNFDAFNDESIQQILGNALDTVKGTQVFDSLFSGLDDITG